MSCAEQEHHCEEANRLRELLYALESSNKDLHDQISSALAERDAARAFSDGVLNGQKLLREGHCTGTIGDGFVACGEGGNYCSTSCQYKAERDAAVGERDEATERAAVGLVALETYRLAGKKWLENKAQYEAEQNILGEIIKRTERERDEALSRLKALLAQAEQMKKMQTVYEAACAWALTSNPTEGDKALDVILKALSNSIEAPR